MTDYIITPNPDFTFRKKVEEAIKENDGYCCCSLFRDEDTKCICKDFREQQKSGFCHCGRYYKVPNNKVVALCGSTRFKDEFLKAQKDFTLQGYIVLSVGLFGHSGDEEVWDNGNKFMLDEMHKRKIDMADLVYVINPNGYIGESTRNEINWARELGKQIEYLED